MFCACGTMPFVVTLLPLLLPLLLPQLAASVPIEVPINQGAAGFFNQSAVIGIMSSVGNFRRRQMVRSTYIQLMKAPLRLKLYFAIGLEDVSPADMTILAEENTHYGDLALLHGVDDAPDKPELSHWKVLGFFRFVMSLSLRYDYIIKSDHDTYIHPINLQLLLSTLPSTRAYWGQPFTYDMNCLYRFKACADCQYLRQHEFSSHYQSGGFYLLSRDLVSWIVANQGPMRLVTDTVWGFEDHQWEDHISGLWVTIAMSSLDQGIVDLEQAGIRGYDVLRGLEPLNIFGDNMIEAGQFIEWWNLEIWFWGGISWNQFADLDEPRNGTAKQMPQPATVAVHHAIKEEEFLMLHNYFVRSFYYQWTVCAHVNFKPTPCRQLLIDKSTKRSRLTFLLDFVTMSA